MTNNKLQGLSRSNAYIRSMRLNKESDFKKLGQQLSPEVRTWIITGEGNPFVDVESCDIKQALKSIEDINKLSIDDIKWYLEYLITLEHQD